MSYWEEQRKNLNLFTVYEVSPAQQLQMIRWLKMRSDILLSSNLAFEAESVIHEFEDYEDTCL